MNHVTSEFYKEAYWTAASWGGVFWKFEGTGLLEEYFSGFKKPQFVKGSRLSWPAL